MQRFVSFINEKYGGVADILENPKRVATKTRLGTTELLDTEKLVENMNTYWDKYLYNN